jgi:hypothetical protein
MKVKVSNIKFEVESKQIKIPKDVNSIKEWLKEYSMPIGTDRDALLVYIRTLLFESNELTHDQEIVKELDVVVEDQPWCLDVIDSTYDQYEIVNVEYNWPDTFDCDMPEEYALRQHDDRDVMLFDYLRQYMPVSIVVKEWLLADLKAALDAKLVQFDDYIQSMIDTDGFDADMITHNIAEAFKDIEELH